MAASWSRTGPFTSERCSMTPKAAKPPSSRRSIVKPVASMKLIAPHISTRCLAPGLAAAISSSRASTCLAFAK